MTQRKKVAKIKKRISEQERRQQILLSCMQLYGEKGVYATTRELAYHAKVSEALLFKHFKNKDELFRAIENYVVEMVKFGQNFLSGLPPGTASLVQITFLNFLFVGEGLPVWKQKQIIDKILIHSLLKDGRLYKRLQPMVEQQYAFAEACLRGAVEEGAFHRRHLSVANHSHFTQHLALAISLFSMHHSANYHGDQDTVLEDAIRFCLMGSGMKADVIDEHLDYRKMKSQALSFLEQARP